MDLINLTHYYFYYALFHSLCLKHGLRSKTLHLLHKNQICYHSTNNYKRLYLKDYQKNIYVRRCINYSALRTS